MIPSLRPRYPAPPDFDAFWARTKEALAAVPPAVESGDHPGAPGPDGDMELSDLTFSSLGGARIRGYLLRWRDGRPRPLIVHAHGYAGGCVVQDGWARRGFHVIGLDVRGFGRSAGAVSRNRWGYMLTGITSPESYVLRGAVCDYVRAAEVASELLGDGISRTVLYGYSFAGALALMAEGVRDRASDLLVAGVPTFGWAEGRHFFVRTGSGSEINAYLEERPDDAEDVMTVLRYFDTVNFARRVRAPALIGVGLEDEVVPPPTVYAIANHLAGPHEVMEFPVSHSGGSPLEALWSRFEDRWTQLALDGVPAEFGGRTVRVRPDGEEIPRGRGT